MSISHSFFLEQCLATLTDLENASKPENIKTRLIQVTADINKQLKKCKEIALIIRHLYSVSKELNKNNSNNTSNNKKIKFENKDLYETLDAYTRVLFFTINTLFIDIHIQYYLKKINSVSSRVTELTTSRNRTAKPFKKYNTVGLNAKANSKKLLISSSIGGSNIRRSNIRRTNIRRTNIRRTKKIKGGFNWLLMITSVIIC